MSSLTHCKLFFETIFRANLLTGAFSTNHLTDIELQSRTTQKPKQPRKKNY